MKGTTVTRMLTTQHSTLVCFTFLHHNTHIIIIASELVALLEARAHFLATSAAPADDASPGTVASFTSSKAAAAAAAFATALLRMSSCHLLYLLLLLLLSIIISTATIVIQSQAAWSKSR